MKVEHLSIEGKIPTDIQVTDETITFVCGEDAFRAYHMQDCCESVQIHDVSGDFADLHGKAITEATQSQTSDEWPEDVKRPNYMPESYTWTTQTFCADGFRVVVRWLGESNGYYGEGVYFERTHVPIDVMTNEERDGDPPGRC